MSNNKSKIVISTVFIAILGFLWYGIRKKKESNENEGSLKTPMENECFTNDTKDKIERKNNIREPESAEELLYQILKSRIKEKNFNNANELVDSVVSSFIISAKDMEWCSEIPTNFEGFELFMKQHGLYGAYLDVILSKN